MRSEEIRQRTQAVWDRFYSLKIIWKTFEFYPVRAQSIGFHTYFQTLPPDVCQYRPSNG